LIPDATRSRLLGAAVRVIDRGGPSALTLASVAAEAGVSKGGLLYHFATKEALVDALVADWLDRVEAETDALAAQGGWGRGYVRVCQSTGRSQDARATNVALLAALAADPDRLTAVHHRWASWQAHMVEECGEPVAATVARLAADGLWLADLFGLAPPRGALRAGVVRLLLELADGSAAAARAPGGERAPARSRTT
jgi:AcrR family transcriptional regulator